MSRLKYFTFWEGKAIPEYLQFTLESIRKHLDLTIVNYNNLYTYIDEDELDIRKLKQLRLLVQSDVVSVFLLNRYKAGFIDIDSILLNDLREYERHLDTHSLVMTGLRPQSPHLCFMLSNGDSPILRLWETEINKRLQFAKYNGWFHKLFNRKMYRYAKAWDLIGNGIIDDILEHQVLPEHAYKYIDNKPFFPELALPIAQNSKDDAGLIRKRQYRKLYFSPLTEETQKALDASEHCFLHNSWTPKEVKAMSKQDVLAMGTGLSYILKKSISQQI